MKTSTPSRLTRMVVAALFSEKTSLTIFSVLAAAMFFCATTDHEKQGAICGALMLPWIIAALKSKS